MKQLLQCNNNSNSYKENSRLKKKTKTQNKTKQKKWETATVQMKAEVNAKQSNTWTNIDIKIYNNSHSNIQEKQIVQIHRQRKDAHSTTSAHMFSPSVPRSCFVLTRRQPQ